MVNMTSLLKHKNIYSLSELSKSCSTIVNYSEDSDSDKDSDDEDIFDDENQIPNIVDKDDDEGNIISNSLSNISQQNFKGCRIYDRINQQQMKKYFRIYIDSSVKYTHKQTAYWLLTTSKIRLSNDQLQCIQGR